MVKPYILILLFSLTATSNAWWWDNDDGDDTQEQLQQQITRLEYEVDQQQHAKDTWQIIAFVLGIGCVVSLVTGAAIGSHASKAVKEEHP